MVYWALTNKKAELPLSESEQITFGSPAVMKGEIFEQITWTRGFPSQDFSRFGFIEDKLPNKRESTHQRY